MIELDHKNWELALQIPNEEEVPGRNAVLQQHQQWLNIRFPQCTSHEAVQV